jgi:hypothetical protein
MRTYRAFSAGNLRVVVLIVCFVVPIVGCYESPTSPCHSCWDDHTAVVEREFTVDYGATVWVDDFVGRVTYRTGGAGTVRVVATKRAERRSDLDCIALSMNKRAGGVDIRAENPEDIHDASVDLEITAPADATPRMDVGVGDIEYRGRPRGACRFATSVGSVRLRLPTDVSITVELSAAVGSIFLDFAIDGVVTSHPSYVNGRIGRGDDGDVCASTSVGNISLIRW